MCAGNREHADGNLQASLSVVRQRGGREARDDADESHQRERLRGFQRNADGGDHVASGPLDRSHRYEL